MGIKRNGARSFLNVLYQACKLSRLPGFETGLRTILGDDKYLAVIIPFQSLCNVIDALVALDNYYNQKDAVDDDGTGEDVSPPI